MEEVEIREKKRSSGLIVFLLCVAFLLIGAGASYYYLTVYVNKGKNINQDNNAITLNTNGALVKELISRIDYDRGCGIEAGLYKKSNLTADDMSDDYRRALVAKEAYGKKIDSNITFKQEEFQNAIKTLFGTTVQINDSSMTNICPNIFYDAANQVYREQAGTPCNVTCGQFKTLRHIVKAEKTDKNIFIYVAVANLDQVSRKIYNVNDDNSVVQGIDGNTFDISVDYEKVNNYKYTYNYDSENNNYIFKSIDLVK